MSENDEILIEEIPVGFPFVYTLACCASRVETEAVEFPVNLDYITFGCLLYTSDAADE